MPRIVVLGEALIDLFAEKGASLRGAKAFHPRPGGAPANVAVALARLGASVGFIGKVGADDFGAFLIDVLAGEGVDTRYFVADASGPTMLAVVASPTPTQQNFILYQGATATLRPEDFDKAYIETADVFVHGSVTLANPSGAALAQAARWARQAGKEVIFDVNLRPGVWPDLDTALQRILVALTSASVVKVNEVETEFLTGTRDPARGARRLIEQGLQLCCVSLGDDGAYFATSAASGHVPAFKVEAVDTTGCGDAFVAGLAFELSSRGKPPKQLSETELRSMIRFANACGALTATQLGAMSALPDRAAVEALLQSTNAAK